MGVWIALLSAQVATSSAAAAEPERVAARLLALLESRELTRAEVRRQAESLSRPELAAVLAAWKRIAPPDERGFAVYEDLKGYGTGAAQVGSGDGTELLAHRDPAAPEPEVGLVIGEVFAGFGALLLWRIAGAVALIAARPDLDDPGLMLAIGGLDGVVSSAMTAGVVWGIAQSSDRYRPSFLHALGGAAGVYVAGLMISMAMGSDDVDEGSTFGLAAAAAGVVTQPLGASIAVNVGKLPIAPPGSARDPFASEPRLAPRVPVLAFGW